MVAQPRGRHQQQQRCQRQIDKLARGQHHAAEQQRRQPGRGERLAPVGAEGCIEQQRRKGKAAPQQRGIPAEAGRQMQRHRQQRCRCKHPLAEGRRPDSQRRQRRKQQQVCQPPQQQRGGKPQMQQIGEKDRRRAGQIEQRVLVGLQLVVLLMTVKRLLGRGQKLRGERLPCKHGRVFVLQVGVLVPHTAEGRCRGDPAHPPFLAGQIIGPAAGKGEALVDMVFLIRCGVGRQHKAVQQPKAQHQHKHKAVQRQFFAKHCPDSERRQHGSKARHKQEKPRQIAADALVGDLHRHRAVHSAAADRHLLLPECHAIAVAHSKDRIGRVMGRDGQPVTAALTAGHRRVQPQSRILVRHDIIHRADRAGQLCAGISIIEHHLQRTAGLLPGQVKLQPDRQQILVVGEHLLGGLAVMDQLCAQKICNDLAAALRHLRAHLGQPEQHHRRQQHNERCQRGQQGGIFFLFWIFHAISRKCEITTPRRTPFPLQPSSARRRAKFSRPRRARHLRRRAGGRYNLRGPLPPRQRPPGRPQSRTAP